MSRIIVLGPDYRKVGEIRATCSRGYALIDANTGGGMSTTITISEADAMQPWMKLGRMIYIEGGRLPDYAGFIDTPWNALDPLQMTVYNADYLLTLRSPETAGKIVGGIDRIFTEANALGGLGVTLGNVSLAGDPVDVLLTRTQLYGQLINLVKSAQAEIVLRPEFDDDNRLTVYFDVSDAAGENTGFLLHDGLNANMKITGAHIDGVVRNRIVGTNSKQPPLDSPAQVDTDAADEFMLRNQVIQFDGVADISQLINNAQAALQTNAWPRLLLDVNMIDDGDTWLACRPGNTAMVHAANIYLPGQKGWRGEMRMRTLHYDEPTNTLSAQLETAYVG
jgi:hypothetical protein